MNAWMVIQENQGKVLRKKEEGSRRHHWTQEDISVLCYASHRSIDIELYAFGLNYNGCNKLG